MQQINREFASKVLETVNAGLVGGLGIAKPGQMCVEAVICYAMGVKHGDKPSCVGAAVNSFMIRLNDASWPTDKDRTETLRRISIAQLGSNTIDQKEFARLVTLETIRKMIPIALRAAAKLNPKFADELEEQSLVCEGITDLETGRKAAQDSSDLALRVRAAAADAAAADAYAAAAADAYAAYAAAAYAAYAAAAAADAAYAAAAYAAAAYAAAAYAYAAYAAAAARLEVLKEAAQIGLDALIELKSPGVEFLDLCE